MNNILETYYKFKIYNIFGLDLFDEDKIIANEDLIMS